MHQNPTHWGLSRKLCASEMNHHPSFLSVLEDHVSSSSSSSDSSTGREQYQSHSFHPINQGPPVWANTERPAIPPSPIHTTSSFDRFANSPLPLRNPFGGGETLSNPADAFAFDGYHGTEREDNKLDAAASPAPPSSFACGFAFHQFQPFEDHPPVEPHNSFVSHYTAYRFEPQYLPSTWHAMYKPSEMDRKPPPSSFTPNRPAISPVKHPGAPAFLSSPAMVPPFSPAVRAPANVPPVASRDPEAYSASNTSPRTEAAGSSPTSLASNRPHPTRRSKKVRGGRRQPVPPQHQGHHAHQMPTKKELDGAATNRAKNAIHSWYQRYNELVDYANKFGDTAVPQQYEDNHALGIWVNKQRMELKAFTQPRAKTSMTEHRMALLEKIDFEWAKPKGVAAWDEKYQELKEYKAKHGNCHVPTKHKGNRPLGRWVSTQRNMKKNYENGILPKSLTLEELRRRIDLLEEINFAWSMVDSPKSETS